MDQGRDKVQEFIQQASSLHVVSTIYYALLVILAMYCHQVIGTTLEALETTSPLLLSSTFALIVIGLVKIFFQWSKKPRKGCSDSEFDLLVVSSCAVITYALVFFVRKNAYFIEIDSLLYSFLPMALFVLVVPVTWRKQGYEFVGFFGFLEWSLLLSVFGWSGAIVVQLFLKEQYIALLSNAFVLCLPFFLKLIKRRHVERLKSDFHREIYQDPLTKISNRKHFYDEYDKIRAHNKKSKTPEGGLGVIFIDIDHFKKYNDQYGHEEGDNCLVMVAKFLSNIAKAHEMSLYRIGGEEFLLTKVLSQDEWEELLQSETFTRWRAGELFLDIPHIHSPSGFVTLSAGEDFVTKEKIYGMNAVGTLKEADKRLYAVKEGSKGLLLSCIDEPFSK